MGTVHWKLKSYLDENDLKPWDVETEAARLGQSLGGTNIYRLVRGAGPARLDLKTLATLIEALRNLTGRKVTPNNLLEFVNE